MSTNTLLKEIIGTLRNLRLEMIGTQWEMCGHAIDCLQEVLKYVPEPELSHDPTLCLETPEENMKPDYPVASMLNALELNNLLDEIYSTFRAIGSRVDVYSGPQEKVLKPLYKALKHLDKALTIMEGDED